LSDEGSSTPDKNNSANRPIRRVTEAKAPRPVTMLNTSHGLSLPHPAPGDELIRIPDLPPHYSSCLRVVTKVLLNRARKTHPGRGELVDFCQLVIRELTPEARKNVEMRALKASSAIFDKEELVEGLVRANSDPDDRSRIEETVKRSDGWANFDEEMLAAEQALNQQLRPGESAERNALTDPDVERATGPKASNKSDAGPGRPTGKQAAANPDAVASKIQANPRGCVTTREAAAYFEVVPKTIRAWANGDVAGKKLTYGVKHGTITNDSILRLQKSLKSTSEQ